MTRNQVKNFFMLHFDKLSSGSVKLLELNLDPFGYLEVLSSAKVFILEKINRIKAVIKR